MTLPSLTLNSKLTRLILNLTKAEMKALKSLQEKKSIMIKPADKGSAILMLDRSQYLWEGNRHVSDPNYYITLYPETIYMVNKLKIVSGKTH